MKKKHKLFIVNSVPLIILLIIISTFFLELKTVEGLYQEELNKSISVNVNEVLEDRILSERKERFHEGRDYGKKIKYSYNQYGFRYKDNVRQNISHNRTNIIFLGDSITEGQFVSYNETLPYLFKRKLDRPDIHVYSLGVIGLDTWDEFLILKEFYNVYKPKIVIWQWFLNDYHDYYPEATALKQIFEEHNFFFESFLKSRMKNRIFSVKGDFLSYESSIKEISSQFDIIRKFVDSKEIKVIFIMYPLPEKMDKFDFGVYADKEIEKYQKYYLKFKRSAKKHNFSVIELENRFPDHSYKDGSWTALPHDPHPNLRFNNLVAEYLSDTSKVVPSN